MIDTMTELAKECVETEFVYRKNGEQGYWLEVIEIKEGGSKMKKQKIEELEKAINSLRYLFGELEDNRGDVMVGRASKEEVITVIIRGAVYDVNVSCENCKQMVKSVVDKVILKI